MKFGIVETPFAPRDKTLSKDNPLYQREVQQNQDYARRACHILLTEFNTAPFASHLLYTQEHILDDTIESERNLGISAGLELAKCADASFVFYDLGISSGMLWGIKSAIENDRELHFISFQDYGLIDKLPADRPYSSLKETQEFLLNNNVDILPYLTEKQKLQLTSLESELDGKIKQMSKRVKHREKDR